MLRSQMFDQFALMRTFIELCIFERQRETAQRRGGVISNERDDDG